jgi:periplasmic divalent cation tolerance protein
VDLNVVLCTVPDAGTGASIARTLVEERLAACVNVIPGVRSIYSWKGGIQDDAEVLIVIKARASRFGALADRIAALHPYEVPEIVALDVPACHEPYLAWVLESTGV